MFDFVYLASQSPRRSQLLAQIGVSCQLLLPQAADETDQKDIEAVLAGESASVYVQRVTWLKLDAAMLRLQRRGWPQAPVLCADTTVALGRRIYGKPKDELDAQRMLTQLSGRTHRVLTAVALQSGSQRQLALSISRVTLAPLSLAQIAAYVASRQASDKAGAYGIQGPFAQYVQHVSGSYSGIMGLPLFETAQLLRLAGLLAP